MDEDKWLFLPEAAQRWKLHDSTIRWAIKSGRIRPDECKKIGYGGHGGVWMVKESAMYRLYGEPKFTQTDINK